MNAPRGRRIVAAGILGPVEQRPPARPGAGEALIRVRATSVNYHDLVGIDGGIPGLPVPRVPFSDACGVVTAVGEDVDAAMVGKRVVASFYTGWLSGPPSRAALSLVVGDAIDGALQEELVLPARTLVPAPAHLSDEEAATLGCAGVTAWRSVVVEGGIGPGSTVVIQGTGGVSLFALGFARMMGARVIVTSSSDAKLQRALALGADMGINYRDVPEWARAVRAATGGEGADLVVEVGGGGTLGQAVRAVRHAGHVSVIGVLTGTRAADFPLAVVMSRNVTMRGITVGSTSDLASMCRAVELHRFRPVLDSVFDLAAAHEAVDLLRRQRHFGKIAVRIDAG